tara:strand:- start:841 stop:1050 length:210 start_codon:yes stop_codon:yes gene_type:complete
MFCRREVYVLFELQQEQYVYDVGELLGREVGVDAFGRSRETRVTKYGIHATGREIRGRYETDERGTLGV